MGIEAAFTRFFYNFALLCFALSARAYPRVDFVGGLNRQPFKILCLRKARAKQPHSAHSIITVLYLL